MTPYREYGTNKQYLNSTVNYDICNSFSWFYYFFIRMMMERVSRMWNTLMIVIMELKKGLTHQHSSSRGQPLLRPQATKRMMGRPRSKVVKRPVNFVNMFFSCATVSLLLYQHLYLFITNLKCTKYSILSNDIENVLIFCHFSKLCI